MFKVKIHKVWWKFWNKIWSDNQCLQKKSIEDNPRSDWHQSQSSHSSLISRHGRLQIWAFPPLTSPVCECMLKILLEHTSCKWNFRPAWVKISTPPPRIAIYRQSPNLIPPNILVPMELQFNVKILTATRSFFALFPFRRIQLYITFVGHPAVGDKLLWEPVISFS